MTTNNDPLDHLLQQLAAQTPRAQQIWEAEYRADEANEIEDDEEIEGTLWLTMERSLIVRTIDPWMCGYRVQQDEVTRWALKAEGATPLAAAEKLLTMIEAPTSNPEYAPTEDHPF